MHWSVKIAAGIAAGIMFGGAASDAVQLLPYHFNWTDSLPRGLYEKTKEPITYGTLISECLPKKWAELAINRGWIQFGACPNGTMPLLKKVVALPGDRVEFNKHFIRVNGEVLLGTKRLEWDSQGRQMPVEIDGEVVLGSDEYVAIADNIENSLDARNMGTTKRKDIVDTWRPTWVEGRYDD